MLFVCTSVKVSSISSLTLVWICVKPVLLAFTWVLLCCRDVSIILIKFWRLSGLHLSPWPCCLPVVYPVDNILVSLFFSSSSQATGSSRSTQSGKFSLKDWVSGSHKIISGSTMLLHSCKMKDWFPSPRSSSTLIFTIHEIFSLCCLGDSHSCV